LTLEILWHWIGPHDHPTLSIYSLVSGSLLDPGCDSGLQRSGLRGGQEGQTRTRRREEEADRG
jgi:hypothetical protein